MRRYANLMVLLMGFVSAAITTGCATHEANPAAPRPNTGYVDFRATQTNLYWKVSRFNDHSQSYDEVYSSLKAPQGDVLRLSFAPGSQRLRITFLNQVVAEPVDLDVVVVNGKITPVSVELTAQSDVAVQSKQLGFGATVKGPAGRRVRTSTGEMTIYGLSASAGPPVDYRPKSVISSR